MNIKLQNSLDIVASSKREIESVMISHDYESDAAREYAAHVTLLLLASKIKNYLKESAGDKFKERFMMEG